MLLKIIRSVWKNTKVSPIGETKEAEFWSRFMAEVEWEDAQWALESFVLEGREFAPNVGQVKKRALGRNATPAPSFEEVKRTLAKHTSCCFSSADRPRQQDTVEAVRNLTSHGVHEAIVRFVQFQGAWGCRMMPDDSLYGLDLNGQADLRDLARSYERRVVPDYDRDPTRGLALARANNPQIGQGQLRRLDPGAGI